MDAKRQTRSFPPFQHVARRFQPVCAMAVRHLSPKVPSEAFRLMLLLAARCDLKAKIRLIRDNRRDYLLDEG